MNAIRAALAVFVVCTALVVLAACSRDCAPVVRDGWVRWLPMEMPMTAGFGRIENSCDTPVIIVAASSPRFAEVSLHETRIDEGISRMRAVPELHVPAGATVVLQPGGLHLMLMQPQSALQQGETIQIDFALKDGGTLRGEMTVRAQAP